MSRRGGPRTSHSPAELVERLDAHTTYETGGTPKRRRLHINGVAVSDNDARMIRRWRTGKIKGVTAKSADALLQRHNIPTDRQENP